MRKKLKKILLSVVLLLSVTGCVSPPETKTGFYVLLQDYRFQELKTRMPADDYLLLESWLCEIVIPHVIIFENPVAGNE